MNNFQQYDDEGTLFKKTMNFRVQNKILKILNLYVLTQLQLDHLLILKNLKGLLTSFFLSNLFFVLHK